ncbi:hypothetical protein RF11_12298 [Thelohanellus kitauei]|uniref:Uncharacterized protein n=1 Tax=Thelohanellus kitauei TaxID=669202 RepID=A0A0C2N9A0_THEKT|nr:hypothetical protein RF11_12298 [Thelohanellus kitauei]
MLEFVWCGKRLIDNVDDFNMGYDQVLTKNVDGIVWHGLVCKHMQDIRTPIFQSLQRYEVWDDSLNKISKPVVSLHYQSCTFRMTCSQKVTTIRMEPLDNQKYYFLITSLIVFTRGKVFVSILSSEMEYIRYFLHIIFQDIELHVDKSLF